MKISVTLFVCQARLIVEKMFYEVLTCLFLHTSVHFILSCDAAFKQNM